MKKIIVLFLFLMICSLNLFAYITLPPDFTTRDSMFYMGFGTSFSYDIGINHNYKFFTFNVIEIPLLFMHWGMTIQFSPEVNIFGIYSNYGFIIYPFKRIFSITGNLGHNCSFIILHHFSYIASVKFNFDIPIRNDVLDLTLGTGLRHRNAIKIGNYLQLKDSFYNIYNSYFFEIGLRLRI